MRFGVRALVWGQRLTELEEVRVRLPLDDPDRHALDVMADARFAALACACPELCACDEEDGR